MSCEIVVEDFVGGDAHIAPRGSFSGMSHFNKIMWIWSGMMTYLSIPAIRLR